MEKMKPKSTPVALIVVLVIIALIAGLGGGYYYSQFAGSEELTDEEMSEEEVLDDDMEEEDKEEEEDYEEDDNEVDYVSDYATGSDASFYDERVVYQDSDPDFMEAYKDDILEIYRGLYEWNADATWEGSLDYLIDWYEVGEVTSGDYTGYNLYVLDNVCDGPCFSKFLYRFVYDPVTGRLVYLPRHSNDREAEYLAPLFENRDNPAWIEGLEPPDEIEIPGMNDVIVLAQKDYSISLSEGMDAAFGDPLYGPVYGTTQIEDDSLGTGCFYWEAPDGTVSRYDYNPGFGLLGDEGDVWVTWNDQSDASLSQNYGYLTGSCGIAGHCYLLEDAQPGNLEVAGTADNGVVLYTAKDPYEGADGDPAATSEQQRVDELYQYYLVQTNYRAENEGYAQYTFEEYLDLHPVLFWQDPFGRWSVIAHNDIKPIAECGKPVIYLYPEETTDVNVQVHVAEFTVTDPQYGEDGWNVKASPDGTLYNYADGETYPYLFWEGHTDESIDAVKGFMVARKDVPLFLWDSLTELGLNLQEKLDFMMFWVPRMLDNPEDYFFVSFLGTQECNEIAPLEITPAPDTLLRIFMYYHPTAKPFAVTEQDLTTRVKRNGFTVVEWGGTSSVPWVY